MEQNEIEIIKRTAEDFFNKMTFSVSNLQVNPAIFEIDDILSAKPVDKKDNSIELAVWVSEPQILIGEKGQTLFEIQKLLRMILSKKIGKGLAFCLDINDYKKKKNNRLKSLAKEVAETVMYSQKEKSMFPMSAYERMIIHAELSCNPAVKTESRGQGENRRVVIMPKN